MIITPIKTDRIRANDMALIELLDRSIESMSENSVLAITSKIVSLCEGRVVPITDDETLKGKLVSQEASYYLPPEEHKYGISFTITNDTLIPTSGIDESNGDGNYILWPSDSQKTANEVRKYLKSRFGLKNVGVVITDSTCTPLRYGTIGISLAHSGFKVLNNYIGKPDLFGRPMAVSQSNIANGLSAAAVVVMGEGDEQTPLALISDLSFVNFVDDDPSEEELAELRISRENDLFAPFLDAVDWKIGDK